MLVVSWLVVAVPAALQAREGVTFDRTLESGLQAMVNLSSENTAHQAQLGELGACAGECMLGCAAL